MQSAFEREAVELTSCYFVFTSRTHELTRAELKRVLNKEQSKVLYLLLHCPLRIRKFLFEGT